MFVISERKRYSPAFIFLCLMIVLSSCGSGGGDSIDLEEEPDGPFRVTIAYEEAEESASGRVSCNWRRIETFMNKMFTTFIGVGQNGQPIMQENLENWALVSEIYLYKYYSYPIGNVTFVDMPGFDPSESMWEKVETICYNNKAIRNNSIAKSICHASYNSLIDLFDEQKAFNLLNLPVFIPKDDYVIKITDSFGFNFPIYGWERTSTGQAYKKYFYFPFISDPAGDSFDQTFTANVRFEERRKWLRRIKAITVEVMPEYYGDYTISSCDADGILGDVVISDGGRKAILTWTKEEPADLSEYGFFSFIVQSQGFESQLIVNLSGSIPEE